MTTENITLNFCPISRLPIEAGKLGLRRSTENASKPLIRALQASKARWRALIENTQDWFWEVDDTCCYTYSSHHVQEILGYTPNEVLGKTPFDFMPPEEGKRIYSALIDTLQNREPIKRMENIYQHRNGSLVVLETNGVPLFNARGEIVGYRCINRDITEKKRRDAELWRKSEELEAIFSSTHILIAVLDCAFNFVRVSNSYAAKAKRDEKSLIGHNHFELYPHEENERLFRKVVERGITCSVTANPFMFTNQPEFGITYWDWTLTPIKNEHGRVTGVILTLIDATECERQCQVAVATHLETQSQLEHRVLERTAALEAANRELEAFSYAVSHDLHAPLRAISNFSAALQEECTNSLSDLGREYLGRIYKATQCMNELIDGLLKLSLISRAELVTQTVDLSALAHDIIHHLHEQEPNRTFNIQITPGLTALGDATLLQLLLQNLLSNAWKFTAHHPQPCIRFEKQYRHGREVFVISDNGIGFEMEHADKLFQPFLRLHSRDQFEGSGIGLATVRRIIERHGGMVMAEGKPQQGATFYFTLSG